MQRIILRAPVAVLAICLSFTPGLRAAPETLYNFQEVYDLLKANLAGTSEAELDRAAVRGLLDQLHGKVTVVGERAAPEATNSTRVTSALFENRFGYLR